MGPQSATSLVDNIHLLLENSPATVASQYHEISNGPLTGVKILIQTTGC